MRIHEVPGMLTVEWRDDVKAVVDTWTSYSISLDAFRDAVLVRGLGHARKHGGIAWIVDSSRASGAFSPQIQEFIGSDVFPAFAKAGIRYFATVAPTSAITSLTVKRYQSQVGPHGLTLVEAASVVDAVVFLKKNAPAKSAVATAKGR